MKTYSPGIHDIHIRDYHEREVCPGPSIGGSGCVALAPPYGVPAKFWDQSTMNPNREPVDTAALRVGKAIHTLFLEGIDAFQDQFVIDNLPSTGEGSRKAKDALKEKARAEGKIIIRAEGNTVERGWDQIQKIAKALESNPLIRAAFTDGRAEPTLIWQDKETGVWCRARPDWLPNDVTHFPELKTARDASQPGFSQAIGAQGYHIKAAHLMAACEALDLGYAKTFTHYVAETCSPWLTAIHTLTPETIEYGVVQRASALRVFADCLAADKWPGYPAGAQETGLPAWTLSRLQKADLYGASAEGNDHEQFDRSRYLEA